MTDQNADQPLKKQVSVWDLPVRIFHISLIIVVLALLTTGFFAPAWWFSIHELLGYALVGLMSFRIVWAWVGSEYSRFNRLKLSIKSLRSWFSKMLNSESVDDIGHNPPGSWMIITFFILLIIMILTGYFIQGSENLTGLTTVITRYSHSVILVWLHKVTAWILLIAIALHVFSVILHDVILKHALIKSMITGYKQVPGNTPPLTRPKPFGIFWALAVALSITLFIANTHTENSDRWYDISLSKQYDTYANECSDCHFLYHPSLNTKRQWSAMLSSLENHYGEDASLSPESLEHLIKFFNDNNQSHFDTRISVEIGQSESSSGRITDRKFWTETHSNLDDSLFKTPPVYSPANCDACHLDAESGLFRDQNIVLPNT